MRILRGLLLIGAVAAGPALLTVAPAAAQSGAEHIADIDIDIEIAGDGTLFTTETITWDFGGTPRHGIIRDLVRSERYDNHDDRRYEIDIDDVTVDGSPEQYTTSDDGTYKHVKIGDPDETVTGVHEYVITYETRGALLPFDDHDELHWDAIGTQWAVTINRASVTVRAPADITEVTCFSGPERSTLPCTEQTHSGGTATFGHSLLFPASNMTVVVGLPKGAITPEPAPILVRRRTIVDAFAVNEQTMPMTAGVAAVGLGGVFALARRGRDRRWTGSAVDAAMGNITGEEERIGIGGLDAGPVEFVPPDKIKPGELGTLADERVDLRDVTATIIDLAVHGWLRIVELEPEGWLKRRSDYELHRTEGGKGSLRPYESALLNGIFGSESTVKLSELKYTFRPKLEKVQDALYDGVVTQGWYRVRPDRTRTTWQLLGGLLAALGVGLTILVAVFTSFGFVPVPLVIAGLVLIVVGKRMPARTGAGSAMLSRVRGFRRLFDEGEEDTRARFAEQHGIFAEYLPYAIVFGCADKWARTFEGLDEEALGTAGWYGGFGDHGTLSALMIASSMDHFDTVATGTMYASQPSSSGSSGFSGGFSGSGGGGGGGSSW